MISRGSRTMGSRVGTSISSSLTESQVKIYSVTGFDYNVCWYSRFLHFQQQFNPICPLICQVNGNIELPSRPFYLLEDSLETICELFDQFPPQNTGYFPNVIDKMGCCTLSSRLGFF